MTKLIRTRHVAILGLFASTAARAAITLNGSWALGEAGSVSGTGTQLPFVSSVNTANNVTNSQSIGSASIITTGLGAVGSTAAISTGGKTSGAGYFGSTTGFSFTNDWAFQLWVRPDAAATGQAGVLFQTDNNTLGLSARFADNAIVFDGGGDGISATDIGSTAAAVGTWYKLSIIRYNGTNRYYVGNTEVGTGNNTLTNLNQPMIGFGQNGVNGITNLAFDEMRVWKFDNTTDSLSSVQNTVLAIPEPATYGALGAAGLAFTALLRRRRRTA